MTGDDAEYFGMTGDGAGYFGMTERMKVFFSKKREKYLK